MRTFHRPHWFLLGALALAGCATDDLPTAVTFPDGASFTVFAPPAQTASFYDIVDENGNTIWQDITNGAPVGGSFRLFYPSLDGLQECELVLSDIGRIVRCGLFGYSSMNFDDRRCFDREQSYPLAPTYWLDEQRNEYVYMPDCAPMRWDDVYLWLFTAGQPWRVIAAAAAPGGLSFKRWEVSFDGVPAVCQEPSGTTCTVIAAISNTRPYFRLVYGAGFAFDGFLAPIDNAPTVNAAKAGSAIPVNFDLGADHGLGVLAAGSPSSSQVVCDLAQQTSAVESTASAGASGLSYDAETGIYTYVWKTERAWAGTCRQLTVELTDGSAQTAQFRFTR